MEVILIPFRREQFGEAWDAVRDAGARGGDHKGGG
jgi:hypothetical protein